MNARAAACAAAVLLLSFRQSATADPDPDSANWVMPGCRAYIRQSVLEPSLAIKAGICMGTVEAIGRYGPGVCTPHNATHDQTLRIVLRYIDSRPERLNEDFDSLALEALKAAWPCH